MKSFLLSVACLIGLSMPLLVAAQTADPAMCNSTGCHAVLSTIVVNDIGVYLGTTGTETNAACSPISGVYILFKSTAPNYDSIYAGLVANQVAGKPVVLRIKDGVNPCEVSYVEFRN